MKYLMLRGAWDSRTQKSIDDDDDMWMQLFAELCGMDYGIIWLQGDYYTKHYRNNVHIICSPECNFDADIVFARGGFDYYDIKNTAKYAIRYAAGKRFVPTAKEYNLYDLLLVDSEKQKADVLKVYPDANVQLWIKPAANHFKPVEVDKEYDICYIANGQQAIIKNIQWVYDTVPSDLKVLHLGYPSDITPPDNVTCRRVDRIDMPTEISRCKVGIVPYRDIDSAPRALIEMIACRVPVVAFEGVNIWHAKYPCHKASKWMSVFWGEVQYRLRWWKNYSSVLEHYDMSTTTAADYLRGLIDDVV